VMSNLDVFGTILLAHGFTTLIMIRASVLIDWIIYKKIYQSEISPVAHFI
jgi:hypothetical protein